MISRLSWIALVIATGTYLCWELADPDLWWHLTTGRWILAHSELPLTDQWNRFGAGKPWLPYSWTFDVAVAFVWSRLGPEGAVLLKVLLGVGFVSVLTAVYSRASGSSFVGLFLGVFVACACYAHFYLRPQVLAWMLFSLALLIAMRCADEQKVTKRAVAAVVLIFAVWANVHITAVFGILGMAALVCCTSDKKSFLRALGLSLAAVGGTLLTPAIGAEWTVLASKFLHPLVHTSIMEFAPASFDQYPVSFLILQLAVLFTLAHYIPGQLGAPRLIGLMFFVIAGMASIKFLPFAAVFAGMLTASLCRSAAATPECLGNIGLAGRLFKVRLMEFPLSALSVVLLVYAGAKTYSLVRSPLLPNSTPEAAADFLLQNNLPDPVLNSFGDGGYLMFRFSGPDGTPHRLVSIDGRTNVNDPLISSLHDAASQGMATWRDYVRRVDPGTIIWPADSAFSEILRNSTAWCSVFDRSGWAIFVRRSWAAEAKTELKCAALPGSSPQPLQ